jgi:hypothetical protein
MYVAGRPLYWCSITTLSTLSLTLTVSSNTGKGTDNSNPNAKAGSFGQYGKERVTMSIVVFIMFDKILLRLTPHAISSPYDAPHKAP